jgi:hypothetical protein
MSTLELDRIELLVLANAITEVLNQSFGPALNESSVVLVGVATKVSALLLEQVGQILNEQENEVISQRAERPDIRAVPDIPATGDTGRS